MHENYWKTTFGALEYDPDVFVAKSEAAKINEYDETSNSPDAIARYKALCRDAGIDTLQAKRDNYENAVNEAWKEHEQPGSPRRRLT